jgi:hypothetical protein
MVRKLSSVLTAGVLLLAVADPTLSQDDAPPDVDIAVQRAASQLRSDLTAFGARSTLMGLPAEKVVPSIIAILQDSSFDCHVCRVFAYEVLRHHRAVDTPEGFAQFIKGLNEPAGLGHSMSALGTVGDEEHQVIASAALSQELSRLWREAKESEEGFSKVHAVRLNIALQSVSQLKRLDVGSRQVIDQLVQEAQLDLAVRVHAATAMIESASSEQEVVSMLYLPLNPARDEAIMYSIASYWMSRGPGSLSPLLKAEVEGYVERLASHPEERIQLGLLDALPALYGPAFGDQAVELLTAIAGDSRHESVRAKAADMLNSIPQR